MKKWLHLLGQATLLIISWSIIFEIGLRTQQYFGPLYDLDMASVNLDWLSDVVNHQPVSGQLVGRTIWGGVKVSHDDNGIRIINDKEMLAGCRNPVSVLFLGDSFMEGFDDQNTLPYHVAKYFKNELNICIKTFNAGLGSYSPAIFVPQARKLLPILRPDYIVVDIDETDLFDDFVRYRELIVRNERGQNIAVKSSPIGHEFNIGLIKAREHRLYLMRLVAKLWHVHVHMPMLYKKFRPTFGNLAYLQDHDPNLEQKYSEALRIFRQNLTRAGRSTEGFHQGRNPSAVHLSSAS